MQRLMIRFEQGRAAEIAPVVAELAPEYPNLPGLAGTVAWAWCESGHLDRARSALAPLARRSYALPVDPAWLTLMHFTAEAVQQVGDVDAARTIYPMLAPYPDVWSNSAAVSMGVTAYHLGILAATFGETERAEAHLREAIARCQAAGAPAPLGRARIHLARLLARRGATTEARRLLEETLSVAVERSFVNVERRARAVLEDLQ
jgi:tetratricopeptide (TPR) repeat protein